MLDPNHPPAILRAAWHRLRLDAIRAAAINTITELEALEGQLQADGAEVPEPNPPPAKRAALLVCCAELRAEGGLPASAVNAPVSASPGADWVRDYDAELARLRNVAGSLLQRFLGEA